MLVVQAAIHRHLTLNQHCPLYDHARFLQDPTEMALYPSVGYTTAPSVMILHGKQFWSFLLGYDHGLCHGIAESS
jgi:hypothetical protein